jgi:ABC-type dipeptide/oligopeptide/nickel transport system ATPase subunit
MRITSVEVENIGGLDSFKLQPGSVTAITGGNGTGKTSLMNALKAPFEKGYDPRLLKDGEAEGFVKLTTDDGSRIVFSQDERGNDVKYYPADSKRSVNAARTLVQALEDGLALDPLKFLTLKPKQRIEYLLEHSKISFTPEEIAEAIGGKASASLDLNGIDSLRETVFENRKALNSAATEASKAAAAMAKSLGPDDSEDWTAKAAETQTSLESQKAERQKELDLLRTARGIELERVNNDARRRIKEIEQGLKDSIKSIQASSASLMELVEEQFETSINELTATLSEARTKAEAQQRSKGAREQIARFEAHAVSKEAEASKLTNALEKIDKLKTRKLKEEGIPGLDLKKGDIYVDGIQFDALNRAKQYRMAIEICKRGAGDLPLMLIDNADCLVGPDLDEFVAAAAESGMQVIMGRAVEDEFNRSKRAPLTAEVLAQ